MSCFNVPLQLQLLLLLSIRIWLVNTSFTINNIILYTSFSHLVFLGTLQAARLLLGSLAIFSLFFAYFDKCHFFVFFLANKIN